MKQVCVPDSRTVGFCNNFVSEVAANFGGRLRQFSNIVKLCEEL